MMSDVMLRRRLHRGWERDFSVLLQKFVKRVITADGGDSVYSSDDQFSGRLQVCFDVDKASVFHVDEQPEVS